MQNTEELYAQQMSGKMKDLWMKLFLYVSFKSISVAAEVTICQCDYNGWEEVRIEMAQDGIRWMTKRNFFISQYFGALN